MTPAIKLLSKAGISFKVHQYSHEPDCHSYGLEAAEKLDVCAERVFKTLVVTLDNEELAVGILPVTATLSMKLIAQAAGAKKAAMAAPDQVKRTTGYVLGGVSPLAQKKRLRTFIDNSAQKYTTIYVSAGRRGLEIELPPSELAAQLNSIITDITS